MVLLKFLECPSCGSTAHAVDNGTCYTCDECGFQFSSDGELSKPTKIEFFDSVASDPQMRDDAPPMIKKILQNDDHVYTNSIDKFIEENGLKIGNEWIDSEPSWIKVKVACEAAGILGPWKIVKQAGSLAEALKVMRSSLDKRGIEKFDKVLKSLDMTDGDLDVLGKIVDRALGNA